MRLLPDSRTDIFTLQQTGKLKKKRIEPELKLLTQAELLAEAAHTEIENMKSLEVCQA